MVPRLVGTFVLPLYGPGLIPFELVERYNGIHDLVLLVILS